ncbi:hypothetical protein K435DRAFT_590855, partial [Dendrothele bispora CBS 962.96]
RHSSRRPSTAERRATHNAVERARRETLNGRFQVQEPVRGEGFAIVLEGEVEII